jgi:sugar lactone lactonase YvrE
MQFKLSIGTALLLLSATAQVFGQDVSEISKTKYTDLPPLYDAAPKQIARAKTIAEFPVGTFLENIAVDAADNLFVTSLGEGKILKITPDGQTSEFAKVPGVVSGIAFDQQGGLIVAGAVGGKTPSVFQISKDGVVTTTTTIEGGWLLNGVTHLKGDQFLIADSYKDLIWEFDARTHKYQIWLQHAEITRSDAKSSIPGVNGLKVFGNTLYATNMQKAQIVKIPLLAGGQPGTPQVFARGVFGDDFVIDAKGNLLIAAHPYNRVVRVTPAGKTTVIAEKEAGVTGSTSLAFGRGKTDRQAVYVVTNGGVLIPPAEGPQPAKVVRLEVGARSARK